MSNILGTVLRENSKVGSGLVRHASILSVKDNFESRSLVEILSQLSSGSNFDILGSLVLLHHKR